MSERKQIVVSFNMQQVGDIGKLAEIEIRNSADLKRAIEKLLTISPSGKVGNPNFVKKS